MMNIPKITNWFQKERYSPENYRAFLADARNIANRGNLEEIRNELKQKRSLGTLLKIVKNIYAKKLKSAGFRATQNDWEMLAILWLYHEETAEHGVRLLLLGNELLSHPLIGPENEKIFLKKLIPKNHISIEQFLRGVLFHDIGKIALPREVVENSLNDEEMGLLFLKMLENGDRKAILSALDIDPEKVINNKDALRRIYRRGLRPKDAVPVKEIFTGDSAHVLDVLKERGFSPDETLGQIISRHEPEGRKIFEPYDSVVAKIVGYHHPGVRLPKKGALPVVEKERRSGYRPQFLLALIDESDALEYTRAYRKGHSKKEVLYLLARDAESGRLNRGLTYLWLSNRYKELPNKEGEEIFNAHIEAFLSDPQNREAAKELIKTIK